MGKIRAAVVGVGYLGKFHAEKYAQIPEAELVAVVDTDREKREELAQRLGTEAVADHREILDRVDAVSIAVPTRYHHAVARDFLERGIHVLLEKPITTTLAEADDLIRIASAKKLVFQVGHLERFNPAVLALDAVLNGPRFVESIRIAPFKPRGTDVNVVLDLMIHDLDIILHFVRSPLRHVDAMGIPVLSDKVDIANARLAFENGCVANVTASRVTGKTMQKIRFFGTEGYHSVDYAKRELVSLGRKRKSNGETEIVQNQVEVGLQDPLEEEIRSFLEAAENRRTPKVCGKEARKSLSLALAILQSMKTQEEMP